MAHVLIVEDNEANMRLARLLLGILLGVRVLARTRPERELLEGMVRPALTLLDSHLNLHGDHQR